MQTKGFLLTLGLGMAAGGAAVLMLPQQSKARRKAQKAADQLEDKVSRLVK